MKKIFLNSGDVALVSNVDHIFLAGFNWYYDRGYAVTTVKRKHKKMHRLILSRMRVGIFDEVDHINGNTLDNRRINLRSATHKQSGRNQKLPKNNTSG